MTDDGDVGAFVCSCADTCDIDLDGVRDRIDGVAMAASSDLLCGSETVGEIAGVIEERELEELVITCPAAVGQERLERIERETGATITFVDQREGAGWVHDERAATEKTARLVNAARTRLDDDGETVSVGGDVGSSVAVIGDASFAAALPEKTDVTLIADGADFDSADHDLDDVRIERGRVRDVSGALGNVEVTLVARVTEECIDCMECVRVAPTTASPGHRSILTPEPPTASGSTSAPPTRSISTASPGRSASIRSSTPAVPTARSAGRPDTTPRRRFRPSRR